MLAVLAAWHAAVDGVKREPWRAGRLVKAHHIQALNYGFAVGANSAIINKTASQVIPAALMSRAAGAADQPRKAWTVVLHRTLPLFYGVQKTPSC